MWQFFAWKQANWLEVPQHIDPLLETIVSGNKQKFAFCGYRTLLDSLYTFLSTTEGRNLMETRTAAEAELTDEQMALVGRDMRNKEQLMLNNTRTLLGKGKPFGKFMGNINIERMERELFRQDFEGDKIPDAAVAIPAYLSHQSTRDLYKELVTLAVDKTVVSPNKMVSLSTELVKRLHSKNGHRIQIFGLFLREQYYKAISDGAAMFPYQSVDNSTLDLKNPAVQARVYSVEEMGGQFYSREDPHHADPLDPSDEHMTEEQIKSASKEKLDKWNLLKGIAARVTKHKTDAKYPCWLWFSAFDQAYLKCYEAIVFRFCQSKNITRTGKSPFFINSLGEALVQPHSKPLDFSDFALLAGIPKCTSHKMRKMFSRYLYAQRSALLREAEEHTLCHAGTTTKSSYLGDSFKTALAVLGTSWYQTNLTVPQDKFVGSSRDCYVDAEQQERERVGQLQVVADNVEERLEAAARDDEAVRPTKERFVTNPVKIALLEAICSSSQHKAITNLGCLKELFLTGKPVIRKRFGSVILRMLTMLPSSLGCVETLRESLLLFAELHGGLERDARDIMWLWAYRLLEVLNALGRVPHVNSIHLIKIFADLSEEHPYR